MSEPFIPSLPAIINGRIRGTLRRKTLIGRAAELQLFEGNLTQPVDRRSFVFNITGPSGVGKTWLMRQFQAIVESYGALYVVIDETPSQTYEKVLGVIDQIEHQLASQGFPLPDLRETLTALLKQPGLTGKTLNPLQLSGQADLQPMSTLDLSSDEQLFGIGAGIQDDGKISQPLLRQLVDLINRLGELDVRQLCILNAQEYDNIEGSTPPMKALQLTTWVQTHGQPKLTRQFISDIQSILRKKRPPLLDIEMPKQSFVQDIVTSPEIGLQEQIDIVSKQLVRSFASLSPSRMIALFFDSFEKAGADIESWLYTLVRTPRYGSLRGNVLFTVAGQVRLSLSDWDELEAFDLLKRMPLGLFSKSETQDLLKEHHVEDDEIVELIHERSNGLPVFVDLYARQRPSSPDEVREADDKLVEQVMRAECKDEQQFHLALDLALARRFDLDVVRHLAEEGAEAFFNWLKVQSFVHQIGQLGWKYHSLFEAP